MTRSMNQYMDVIASFNVETNSKYLPKGNETYCNFFAQDVMKKLEADLPSGRCATMLEALESGFSKWKYMASYLATSFKAQEGLPAIAITSDHIAIVRPYESTYPVNTGTVRIAQAGGSCFTNKPLSYGWNSNRHSEIKYYYWNE